jgi:hypothetical protein
VTSACTDLTSLSKKARLRSMSVMTDWPTRASKSRWASVLEESDIEELSVVPVTLDLALTMILRDH